MCKQCGLTFEDLDLMTVGMCFDYIDTYLEWQNPKNKTKKATQEDFDKF